MKVSVIIPTYGSAKYLEKAIQSVINQTISNWELIIVDDNNPDTDGRKITEGLILRFLDDSRIRYIKHEVNKNGAAARNTGIALARGDYIAFLDSDDEYMPNRLEKCLDVLENERNLRIKAVYTGCEFRRNGKTYRKKVNVQSGNYLVETLACTFQFCTGSNIFIKHEVISELNGFDETFIRHQDYEFLVRYFEMHDIAAIQKMLVIKNNDNLNLPNPVIMCSIKEHYLNKYSEIIINLPIASRNFIYSAQYYDIADAFLDAGNVTEAKAYMKKSKDYGGCGVKCNIKWCIKRMFCLLRGG